MQLFTRRFTKDIILIVIFGSLLYALTHNPITHPKPKVTQGLWSIQLMQHPLVFGIAGHNFLTLRDENNSIIEEYHGLATDSVTGDWKYVGRKSTDILKAWRFKGSRNYIAQKDYPGIVLEQGDKDVMITAWDKGESCKEEINTMNLPYPPYGVSLHGDTENSNSVAYTLALCMKLDAKRIGLITPGWGKDLLGEEK